MNVSKLFLFDFITVKKIKNYIIAIIVFLVGALNYKDNHPNFFLNDALNSNIGISISFFTTLYIVYTYTTLERIKMYLMLPFEKWEVLYAYIFAIYFGLVLQRLSFMVVIIVLFTKQPFFSVLFLLISALITTIININVLLCLNKKKYMVLVSSVFSFVALGYFLSYGRDWIINLSVLVALLIINILICLCFEPKDLAITREVKARKQRSNYLNYFFYVLLREKVMLVNTVIIVGVILFYIVATPNNPVIASVVWCLCAVNTPLFTMFSGDKSLARQERMLPASSKLMNGMYARFLSVYFILVNIYVLVLQHWIKNNVSGMTILLAMVLIPVEVVISLYLEKRYRIEQWQTKQELWKNLRKYILPILVFLISAGFSLLA